MKISAVPMARDSSRCLVMPSSSVGDGDGSVSGSTSGSKPRDHPGGSPSGGRRREPPHGALRPPTLGVDPEAAGLDRALSLTVRMAPAGDPRPGRLQKI